MPLHFQTKTSAVKELTPVTQLPHAPTLRGHMSALATLVTMEMERNVKVSPVPEYIKLKTIGNRKGDCAWSCSRWQTPPEKICKLQSTNQYNVRRGHWFLLCNFHIFQVVFAILNNFTHNLLFYSHFRLVRTRLTRNFGLHARKPLVQNQIALTHILNGFG